jgi:D-glycero-alpha-D-manno-heptose 1-phosphate guanylyltransferase
MHELSNITAFVLAGGMGTRLRSAIADRPKVLAPVRGRPFLAFLLDRLADAGIRHTVLGTGYMAEAVEGAFGDAHEGIRLSYSREPAPLGTGGALRLALPQLRSDPVLVLNGDSYFSADLGAFARAFGECAGRAALLRTEVSDVSRYGQVHAASDGQLLRFDEKGGASGPGWINTGIYLFRQEVLQSLPADRPVSLEKEVFPALLGRGLYAFSQPGRFIDIGTPESYAAAEAFFDSQPAPVF